MIKLPTLATLSLLLLATGCPPKGPKCDKDDDCKSGEFCVNGNCQQCRNDDDCDKNQRCNKGRCEQRQRCKSSAECPQGEACIDGYCRPCEKDADCGEGKSCRDGVCSSPACSSDDDCPENHECQQGKCVAPPQEKAAGAPCELPTLYFGFDEYVLSEATTDLLRRAAVCIKSTTGRTIRIEGHCDARGTEEYNLALGDRRSKTVKRYLERLGVDSSQLLTVSKGKLEAAGTNPAGWAKDRKVRFLWE